MGGINYVYWMGARLTPWMLYCLQRLDADLQRLFGVRLVLDASKGIRTEAEQTAIFLARYRAQRTGSGPFGDVRWWNGTRYVRHSGLGTVAAPRTSNHEIQGTTAAVDVADSGGAGIGTMGSARSNWLRANAANYGLVPEGFNFGEAWHYAVPNIFNPVPAGGADAAPAIERLLEDAMANPIIDVNSTLWIGRNDGTFEQYETWKAPNSRGIITTVFFGGKGTEDKIPKLNAADFEVAKTVWRQMCRGTGEAVWSHKIPAQTADGLPVKPAVSYRADGYVASTNAIANEQRNKR